MTEPSDENLVSFVAASAGMLELQLDNEALAAVCDAMRGVMKQAALVLNHAPAQAET